ncbi:MAG: hypothetical protein BGO99_01230 [Nitrosospira sp. 56-18]|jgi:hypothetical protein|nr:MAG: hypothetical protein BGO99_01230 [Nitrosospira sp. 56-18]
MLYSRITDNLKKSSLISCGNLQFEAAAFTHLSFYFITFPQIAIFELQIKVLCLLSYINFYIARQDYMKPLAFPLWVLT